MNRGESANIGTDEVPCGNYSDRSEFEIAYRVAKLAIEDAGIDKNEVGAVLCAAHIMGDKDNTEMVFGRMPEAIGAKGANSTCMTNSATSQGQAGLSPGQRVPGPGNVRRRAALRQQ